MSQPDKSKLNSIKDEITSLKADQAIQLKQLISDVIKTFNYKDLKIHSHLNELLLTINTDKLSETDNFTDIQKKLIYLIDKIVSGF